jgi:plasmid stabilization system protein ParE
MGEVVFRPEARRGVVEAAKWYAKDNPALGKVFSDAVDAAITGIVANPHLYAIVTRQTRRAPVPGFPYGVYYRIGHDHLIVTSCTHYRRNPRHWRAE